MNNLQQAVRQAWEAVDAITALCLALEQSAEEGCGCNQGQVCPKCDPDVFQKPAEEPAAKYSDIVSDGGMDPRNKFDVTPAPQPAREWVGLTDDEIYEAIWPLCTSDNQVVKSLVELSMDEYRAIEKALKEKNT